MHARACPSGRRRPRCPRCPFAGSVLAKTTDPRRLARVRDERLRAVEDVLVARRTAVVFMRATSEPGVRARVSPKRARGSAPRASGGSHVAFCSSEPAIRTGPAPRPLAPIDVPMPEQPQLSSSPTSIPSNAEQPEAAERLGDVEVHEAELVRLRDHVGRMRRVLVVLGRLRPDLLLGELARERAQLLLLVASARTRRRRRRPSPWSPSGSLLTSID